MKIAMMTNTYLPHVGGVARSVESFTSELRKMGHDVLVVAPTFEGMPTEEMDVVRVPALQRFNGSDFSVRLPIPGLLSSTLDLFEPDVVHSHHPFLLGDTALRAAALRNVPLVFTHHTLYERYTHYVPGDSDAMRTYAKLMSVEYANLCDHVIAPSQSILELLHQRGVYKPVTAIPTGIDPEKFASGDGQRIQQQHGIPADAFVVGHVGRLAPEKNLGFLADCVAEFMNRHPSAHFLVVGEGPSDLDIRRACGESGVEDRLHTTGRLQGRELSDTYHAMDVFAFASQTETQGMVLAEAMTAGIPVVAIDAPGVREVVHNGVNGRLVETEERGAFVEALTGIARQDGKHRRSMADAARKTAEEFSLRHCTEELLKVYEQTITADARLTNEKEDDGWSQILHAIEKEWRLWSTRAEAAMNSIRETL